MKTCTGLFMALLLLTACTQKSHQPFVDDLMLPMTPVKNQGHSQLCWAYAMLATIETEHIGRGDSVNLSATYVGRRLKRKSQRAMAQTLLNMLGRVGVVEYNICPDEAVAGLPEPRWVYMGGVRYTPQEFAHSVCAPNEYIALTSVAGEPYGELIELKVPDNWEHNRFLNLPADTLLHAIDHALRDGHGVCWEGDISEPGFSFKEGRADMTLRSRVTRTTVDHCMAIVGLAHDEEGRRYYVMKNSWGTNNPYGGLMYVSADYVRHKTIAIYMTNDAYEDRRLPAKTLQRAREALLSDDGTQRPR